MFIHAYQTHQNFRDILTISPHILMGQLNYLTFHLHFVELVVIRPWIIQIYECKICNIFLGFLQNASWKHSMEAYFNISCSSISIDIINGIVISEKIKKNFLMQTFSLMPIYQYIHAFLTFHYWLSLKCLCFLKSCTLSLIKSFRAVMWILYSTTMR